MTRIAVNAALLSIPFDPRSLYESQDRGYLLWLAAVIDRVHEARRKEA